MLQTISSLLSVVDKNKRRTSKRRNKLQLATWDSSLIMQQREVILIRLRMIFIIKSFAFNK